MTLILLVFAFALFVLAALAGYAPAGAGLHRINLVALGLACWVATLIFPTH